MTRGVRINEVSELLEQEIVELPWFNYNLGGSFGGILNKKAEKYHKTHGIIVNGHKKDVSLTKILDKLLNNDFSEIAFFYTAIIAFFTEKVIKNTIFEENQKKNTIISLFSQKKVHIRNKAKLEKIKKMDFDFEDFLLEASKNEKLNFDYDSAIAVYRMQGDDAIFGILCQCFWVNKYCDKFSIKLIDNLPIIFDIEISDFLSGCHFPVMVSPYTEDIKWGKNDNGWYLYQKIDEKWLVLDCGGTYFSLLCDKPLSDRMNFFGGGGQSVPYFICYNWGEIIEVVKYFGQDLLIRDLKNDFFVNYWFIFGKNSKINVNYVKNQIWGTSKYWSIYKNYDEFNNHRNGLNITLNLNMEFQGYCEKKDIVFGPSEAYDWFEIGEKCKTFWKK